MARPAEEQGLGQDIRQVDASTFEGIVARHSAEVAQLANRLLGWPGDVDDVVQDVFFAAYRARAGFRGQCLINQLQEAEMDALRLRARRAAMEGQASDLRKRIDEAIDQDTLIRELQRLVDLMAQGQARV